MTTTIDPKLQDAINRLSDKMEVAHKHASQAGLKRIYHEATAALVQLDGIYGMEAVEEAVNQIPEMSLDEFIDSYTAKHAVIREVL